MLESYITPMLMGYVNKYIKNLKPSDLSLSVWGGDVVLQNLELNLDILQKELNLPVHFLSGRIHELQIHVPWTRITSEPVTITINTIEFVVKLRDPDDVELDNEVDETEKANAREFKKEMQKAKAARDAEHLPPGYVQSVVNKVINNISVHVNNLILKYVEDDIVFSLNVKSVALFSANEDWEQAFVELTLPTLCLRKICNINNLTICLDSRNADGKIEMYQDPILYKCNLSCRILSKYMGLGSVSAYENQLNIYCESLDLSSTDVQLPMIIRLLKLCLGLYYRTLDLPGCKYKSHPAEEILEHRKHLHHFSESYNPDNSEKDGNLDDSSWASWAWSMIPNLQDSRSQVQNDFVFDENAVLLFGLYVTQCSLTLKVTNEAHNNSIVGSKRYEFSPVLNIEMSGCAAEIISKGEEYFDCQLGVCNVIGYMFGDCLCRKSKNYGHSNQNTSMDFEEPERECEDELLFELGCPKDTIQNGVGFLEDSLFRQHSPDSDDGFSFYQKTTLPEKGKQFNEAKVAKKYGALFTDYLYIMELPKENATDLDESSAGIDHNQESGLVKEVSLKRVIVGDCNVFVTSRFCHLTKKIMEFCEDNAPQRKMKDGIYIDNFVMNQLKLGNFSTRGLHVTFHTMKAAIIYPDHVFGRSDCRNGSKDLDDQGIIYGTLLQIDRIDYKATAPMFPNELNALLETEAKPKPVCFRAAYSDYFIKFFGIQLGVCQYKHEFSEPTVLNVVAPFHTSVYAKVFIGKSCVDDGGKLEFRIKMPSLAIGLTKTQLMMLIELAKSWASSNPYVFNQMLVDNVFYPKAGKNSSSSIVKASIIDIDWKYLQTDLVHSTCGSVGSIKVSLQFLSKGALLEKAIMYGPLNTSQISNVRSFFDDTKKGIKELPNGPLLTFTIQMPIEPLQKNSANICTVAKADIKGVAAALDNDLLNWMEYQPSTSPRKRHRTTEKRMSRILSRSFSASTPKKKSYARILGNSPSKTSREQKVTKQDSESSAAPKISRENFLAIAMSILKSIVLKVDIHAFAFFLPVEPMSYGPNVTGPEYNIPVAFRRAFMNKNPDTPNTLVVTMPTISICSSNSKAVDLSCDIPIEVTGDRSPESSLPWSLSGDGFAVYVLLSSATYPMLDMEKYHIWYPASWTMFLAAADASPKTPDDPKSPLFLLQGSMNRLGVNAFADTLPFETSTRDDEYQTSLGFCIHVDLALVEIGISKVQAEVVIRVLSTFMKTFDIVTRHQINEIPVQQSLARKVPNEVRSDHSVENFDEADRRSSSTTSTVGQQDLMSVSTDASVFSGEADPKPSDNVKISLWLQWIVPKISVTFFGESTSGVARPWYKIPCTIEDFSLAFDYQQGEIRMKSKVGSIAVRHCLLRPGYKEWEYGKFGGILVSCDDVLAQNAKALPMLRKSSPRTFLVLNYSRRPLSSWTLGKRFTQVRSEAVIPIENIEEQRHGSERALKYLVVDDDVYQHRLDAKIESLDILCALEPILNVAGSFMTLRSPFDPTIAMLGKANTRDEGESLREGTFQPLPILDIESKGCRIIIPLLDDAKSSASEFAENTVIFSVRSMLVNSDPLNRIASTVLHKDWYRHLRKHQRERSRRTKLWHLQYQIDMNCVSLWSGKWGELHARRHSSSEELAVSPEGQNPALEWNYQMATDSQPIKLTPLFQDFNCRSILSPALKIAKKDIKLPICISSTSVEVNFPKEIAAFCSPYQVNLLMKIAEQTTASLQSIGDDVCVSEASKASEVMKSPEALDSGISSVISLKGTNDLKSTTEPEEHSPQNIPAQSYSPFELFVSGSKFSLSLCVPEIPESSEQSEIYRLVGYADIIQPTLDIRDSSLEVILYDAVISLAGSNRTSNSLPDRCMFDEIVLGTLKGKQSIKTGLFPSALSIKASMVSGVKATIEINRPLYMNLGLEMIATMDLFTSRLLTTAFSQPSQPKTVHSSSQTKMTPIIDEIAMSTCRISVAFLGKNNLHSYKLKAALRSMKALVKMKGKGQCKDSDVLSYECDVDGFEIHVGKNENHYRLLSPCIFGLEGQTRPIGSLKKSDICGLIHIEIGPLHLEYLTAIHESVSKSLQLTASSGNTSDIVVKEETNSLTNHVEYSQDDLKTGSFDFVFHSGKKVGHPLANQIVFTEEDSEMPPSMTWRYPAPRFLSEVTIMPLPFHIDEVMPEDDLAEIPCAIRYWDDIEQMYVTYRHFFLSQSKSETIPFPNPIHEVEGSCQVASEEWQVVVDVVIEADNENKSDGGSIPEDILKEVISVYKTPVSATSLAACIKINSCCVPEKIPRIMCSISIGCIQIILANHFDISENVQPRLLAPFFLDSYTYPSSQESCCLELKSFLFKGSLIGHKCFKQKFTTEFDASLDVMNYKDLSWRNCLALSSFAAEISLNTEKHIDDGSLDLTQSALSFEVDYIRLITSQCIIHTLSMTIDNWKRGLDLVMDTPLLNHYIICNETEDVLRFGQVDTDEDIVLSSGQMYPYSWRSPHNRMMHLCLDSVGDWKWSAPFDIDSERGCTRSIKHSTHSSTVHVEIKKTGGIQKQIVFRGGLYFRNCLKKDVEFELFLHHVELIGHLNQQKITQVPKSFVVPAAAMRPSMSYSPSTVTSVYLRLIDDALQGSWASAINFATEGDIFIPLTLTIKGEAYNIWFTVTHIDNNQFSQLQICVCPFFIVRNHLRWPVVMTATSRDEGYSRSLLSQGRGMESEVLNLAPESWYNVNFLLEGTKECTDPPIPINTTFLEILKKKRKLDLQNIDYSAEWPYSDGCSIPEEQPPRINPQRVPTQDIAMPGPDLNCNLLQRWEKLPTIVIEIKPKFILNNYSEQDLFIRDPDTHLIWSIERHASITSPAIQTCIQFGGLFEGSSDKQWSSQIFLSELRKAAQDSSRDSFCLYQHSTISFSIFNPPQNRCLQFTLTSKTRNDIIIVSICERFCVYNFTGLKLRCFPVLCEGAELEVPGKGSLEIRDSDDPNYIRQIALARKAYAETEKVPDLSEFSIRFFFYISDSSPGLLDYNHAFDLSRDHLRENIILGEWDEEPICVAMTSYMKDGIINVFIDKEEYPSILFDNKTEILFNVSVLLHDKESDGIFETTIDSNVWESEIELGPRQKFCYQCRSFKDNFPKIGNKLNGRLSLRACVKDEVAVSKLLNLNNEEKIDELVIDDNKVFILSQKAANCFCLLISSEQPDFSASRGPINLPVVYSSINKIDVIVVDDVVCEEVFDLTIDKLVVQHNVCTRGVCSFTSKDSKFSLKLGALQVDNQSTDDCDHFPVVVLPLREVSQRYRGESPHNAPFSDTHASIANPLFETVVTIYQSQNCSCFIDDLRIKVEPLEIYAEDTFVYRLLSLAESYLPPLQFASHKEQDMREIAVKSVGRQILHPINIGDIQVEDLKILLSIHASLKMYLSADHMPVVLGTFTCHPTRTIQKELTRKILYHYLTQALVRAGLMLGSLEILANPTGLIRSVGQGIADFFSLPYDGLTRGPSAFVSGISSGIGSFFRHASVGALTSITNFASSLSRNMDRLSLDEQHMIRQEEQRCRPSSQVWPGFSKAFSGFGISLLGAVAGIVDHPISNMQNAETAREAFTGAAKGFGKGLVGIVAKPIGGAMELVSQTGQGILVGTGLTKPPKKLRAALDKTEILGLERESYMKYFWKVIRVEFEEYANLFVVTDVDISFASENQGGYYGAVILTPSAFYLYDRNLNNIRMAFACNEICLRLEECTPFLVFVEKVGISRGIGYCLNQIPSINSDDLQTNRDSPEPLNFQPTTIDVSYPISLKMHPTQAKLLLSQFCHHKDLSEEEINKEVLDIASFKQ